MEQGITFSRIFLVKPGKLDRVRAWMQELSSERRAEALETLKQENLTQETYVLFAGPDDAHYLIGMTIGEGAQLPSDPNKEINQRHSAFKKECFAPFSEIGEVILNLKA